MRQRMEIKKCLKPCIIILEIHKKYFSINIQKKVKVKQNIIRH